jgi:steroid delta-isomerase-like uncharacterized protein
MDRLKKLALTCILSVTLVSACDHSARIKPGKNTNMTEEQKLHLLQVFAAAWNKHDIATLKACMTEDCVFESSAGPDVCGMRYSGQEAVTAAFAEVFATFPDAQWRNAHHFIAGDRAVSEWTFTGTRVDGARVEVNGCDLLTFRDGKIAIKNSYRKNRPPLAAPNR